MSKINWKVRAKNPLFWAQIVVAIVGTVLAYAGISGSEVTTWGKVLDLIVMTFSNPYCLWMVAMAVINAIIDPTTKGVKDSEKAMTYVEPK